MSAPEMPISPGDIIGKVDFFDLGHYCLKNPSCLLLLKDVNGHGICIHCVLSDGQVRQVPCCFLKLTQLQDRNWPNLHSPCGPWLPNTKKTWSPQVCCFNWLLFSFTPHTSLHCLPMAGMNPMIWAWVTCLPAIACLAWLVVWNCFFIYWE